MASSSFLTSTLRRTLPSLQSCKSRAFVESNRRALVTLTTSPLLPKPNTSTTTMTTTTTTTTTPSAHFSSAPNHHRMPDPSIIHSYTEPINEMSNAELDDPTTIPGFQTLIHSPPKDKATIPPRALLGTVVSTKMQKTVNVQVNRYKIHKKYHKRMRYTKKFMAHDEREVCNDGDLVVITPCQKLSKRKHFRVHTILKQKGVL